MSYEALHDRAHKIYFSEHVENGRSPFWAIMDTATEVWQGQGRPGSFEEFLREEGCPEEGLLSKKAFLLSEYHDANEALINLPPEDLRLWAEEHQLDAHTLLALREEYP